jgi:hypothetical protein
MNRETLEEKRNINKESLSSEKNSRKKRSKCIKEYTSIKFNRDQHTMFQFSIVPSLATVTVVVVTMRLNPI